MSHPRDSWRAWATSVAAADLGTPCTEADIAAAEARLGMKLPSSYRDFLLELGGLREPHFEASRLLRPAELRWLRDADPELVAEWLQPTEQILTFLDLPKGEPEEPEPWDMTHLRDALLISPAGEPTLLLLNPRVVEGQEWQACTFNDWHPGGEVHASFGDMLQAEAAMARAPR